MGREPDRPACPICAEPSAPRADNPSFPFCCPQCKLVDLGKWLDGSYRIPGPPASAGDGPAAAFEEDE